MTYRGGGVDNVGRKVGALGELVLKRALDAVGERKGCVVDVYCRALPVAVAVNVRRREIEYAADEVGGPALGAAVAGGARAL